MGEVCSIEVLRCLAWMTLIVVHGMGNLNPAAYRTFLQRTLQLLGRVGGRDLAIDGRWALRPEKLRESSAKVARCQGSRAP